MFRPALKWWEVSFPEFVKDKRIGSFSDVVGELIYVEDDSVKEIRNKRLLEYRDNFTPRKKEHLLHRNLSVNKLGSSGSLFNDPLDFGCDEDEIDPMDHPTMDDMDLMRMKLTSSADNAKLLLESENRLLDKRNSSNDISIKWESPSEKPKSSLSRPKPKRMVSTSCLNPQRSGGAFATMNTRNVRGSNRRITLGQRGNPVPPKIPKKPPVMKSKKSTTVKNTIVSMKGCMEKLKEDYNDIEDNEHFQDIQSLIDTLSKITSKKKKSNA